MNTPATDPESRLVTGTRLAAWAVAGLGAAVLAGWLSGIEFLKGGFQGGPTMKVNTALSFLAAGASLWALFRPRPRPARRALGLLLAGAVALLAALSLIEYLAGVDLGIDQLILPDDPDPVATVHPGRMAPGTAASFLLVAVALLLLEGAPALFRVPAAGAHLLALLGLAGYAYRVDELKGIGPYTTMALPAAAGLWLCSLAILVARPSTGFMAVVVARTGGGRMARLLLAAIPPAIFVVGWASLAGARAGWYDDHFAVALTALLGMLISALIVAWQARALHRVDLERARGAAEIADLNAGLERRVEERTRELQEALAQVKQLQGLLPICAWCKRIRDSEDDWRSLESYITDRTDARFTHAICPQCQAKALGELPAENR